jgi:opacity protein-like surface antigen
MTIKRLLIVLMLIMISTSLHAQRFNQKKIHDSDRYGQWESTLLIQGQGGTDESAENGAALSIDDELGWGLTIGWNWTEKWNLAYKFTMVKPDYSATIVPEDPEMPPQTIDYSMTKYAHQFNVTYHFLQGPITPYIQAGAGWTKLDSNILSRPPTTGCWWDPWWGWICSTTWETFETTEFSYNAGIGIRWDINPLLFMRGSYNREFVKIDAGSLDFDTVTFEFGMMF